MTLEAMPTLAELQAIGMMWAIQGVRMRVDPVSGLLAIFGLPPAQREHVVVAWVAGWAAEWTRLSCPTLTVDRDTAIALRDCPPPPLDFEHRPRWPFYLIKVPGELIGVSSSGGQDYITRLLCMYLNDEWSYIALGGQCELRQWQRSFEFMRAPGSLDESSDDPRIHNMPTDAQDELANRWLCRLMVASAAAEVASMATHRMQKPSDPWWDGDGTHD